MEVMVVQYCKCSKRHRIVATKCGQFIYYMNLKWSILYYMNFTLKHF